MNPERARSITMLQIGAMDIPRPNPQRTLEERCTDAFKAVIDGAGGWALNNDDLRFRGAVWAVYKTATKEEQHTIENSLAVVQQLNVMVQAGAAGMAVHPPEEIPADTIPLLKLYNELKNQKDANDVPDEEM